jgi:DNA-binding XRE family transcriptional regulator
MNAPIKFQVLTGEDGKPAFVVVPYAQFQRMAGGFSPGSVPHAVVIMAFDQGMTPVKAWREHLRLTQAEVALRMGITQAAFAQMESAKHPRKTTLEKIAAGMGLDVEQLRF